MGQWIARFLDLKCVTDILLYDLSSMLYSSSELLVRLMMSEVSVLDLPLDSFFDCSKNGCALGPGLDWLVERLSMKAALQI